MFHRELAPLEVVSESTEQALWRDACILGAAEFVKALEAAKNIGPINETTRITTLTRFMQSVFDCTPENRGGEGQVLVVDVPRPDGTRRVMVGVGRDVGFTYEVIRFSDINQLDGSEANAYSLDHVDFSTLAQRLAC
jgi:hypothetical protein